MTMRNLTGREVVIFDENNQPTERYQPENPQTRTSGPSGGVVVDKVEGVQVSEVVWNKINLPEPQKNQTLIVHRITAQVAAAQGRQTDDLLVPESPVRMSLISGQIIQNDQEDDGINAIVGWQRLARLPK